LNRLLLILIRLALFYNCLLRPQVTEAREQEVVETDVSCDLPSEHEQDCQTEEYTVDAGGACHDEVPIHEAREEGGRSDEDACDQSDAEEQFADRDHFCKPGIHLRIQHELNETAIPVVGDGRASLCGDLDGAHPEAFQGITGLHPGRAGEFVQTGFDPFPTEPYTDSQPENGKAFVTEQHVDKGRGFERLTLAGENISGHDVFSFLI